VSRSVAQLRPADGVATSAADIPGPRQPEDHPISDESAAKRGQRCLDALAAAVRDDPDAYELRTTITRAGRSLIDAVEGIGKADGPVDLVPDSDWPGTREEWFLYRFVSVVAGDDTTIADAVARRAATVCAEKILASPVAAEEIERAEPGWNFPDGLFCEIYQLFFADYVAEFVHAVIAEKVKLVVPALVLVDPSGQIADWVADQITAVLPMPCAEKKEHPDDPRSIVELARDMLQDAVVTALGLPRVDT
jgi:hypothetical protein